ncbi:general transcriptional corepressor trfA [Anastrepha ludens]|uniref:general transcriptional corepressor trfA n=1 Tax=Anastrepha ludens TaxID=28586 RepID=UPI0023AFF271|nr:general transcriptional corepressor trfA [Anastrepha ludens]XP_053966999.1 general transcriptional corepressor trfA [Anastrepha ludens]XP_053967000.1 general transcriptional corepressor trfA [Anastrepha ludens]XP_053967001.1 general transcriptional corepressor trfA [Anastrepha ludens]XP_053967002.1 general transcriptional corepressor trfA [Anastrepha ludens]XP_053967003.1 general transcriptional corepressor trfA [Anastrepha ludens]
MSDTLSRVKLQLRPVNGSILNGSGNGNGSDDKSPSSPATKLLINHGKPNYTIQRSPKSQQNGDANPLNNELQNNNRNNYYPYKSAGVKGTTGILTNGNGSKPIVSTNNNNNISKQNGDNLVIQSTKFNGAFKPANVQQVENKDEVDNQVVLRHVPKPESVSAPQNDNEENVPEFILRQRRIQERLAKENILDFENRRSGYFTHVVISPTSPNRTSLVETMSSPPIVPSLEIPPPAKEAKEASIAEENSVEVSAEQAHEETPAATTNGHVEEEEVAKAIEEVNKAVAGEVDDDKPNMVEDEKAVECEDKLVETVKVEEQQVEEQKVVEHKAEEPKVAEEEHKTETAKGEESKVEEVQAPVVSVVVTSAPLVEAELAQDNQLVTVADAAEPVQKPEAQAEVAVTTADHIETAVEPPKPLERKQSTADEKPKENGHAAVEETPKTNGHADEDVTISHTNGVANGLSNGIPTPSLPTPDPSGALGANYEPKTVVSFSKDLGEPNKYPDTVKVVKTAEVVDEKKVAASASDELKELAKLKFDIKADDNDVQVTPVLRTE